MKHRLWIGVIAIVMIICSLAACGHDPDDSGIWAPTVPYEDVSNIVSKTYYIADLSEQWDRLMKSYKQASSEEDRERLRSKLELIREKLLRYGVEKQTDDWE